MLYILERKKKKKLKFIFHDTQIRTIEIIENRCKATANATFSSFCEFVSSF